MGIYRIMQIRNTFRIFDSILQGVDTNEENAHGRFLVGSDIDG